MTYNRILSSIHPRRHQVGLYSSPSSATFRGSRLDLVFHQATCAAVARACVSPSSKLPQLLFALYQPSCNGHFWASAFTKLPAAKGTATQLIAWKRTKPNCGSLQVDLVITSDFTLYQSFVMTKSTCSGLQLAFGLCQAIN